MKHNVKRILSAMLVLCMAATLMIGSVTEAQAAKYAKSISKTVKTEYDTRVLTFTLKEAATVTITVTCAEAKDGDTYQGAFVSTTGETTKVTSKSNRPLLGNEKGNNKLTMKVKFEKGTQTVSFTSDSPSGTFKVKITAPKKILKYKSLKKLEVEQGPDVG